MARVTLSEEETELVQQAAVSVARWRERLGAELERHDAEKQVLLTEVRRAREQYEGLVAALAQKYVPQGRFKFDPQAGAFEETGP